MSKLRFFWGYCQKTSDNNYEALQSESFNDALFFTLAERVFLRVSETLL